VITPSAARGILEAVLWKPAIRYVIDEIVVCHPIRFENIRRNEVASKVNSKGTPIIAVEDRQQRAALVLRDVRYVIKAHFIITEKAGPDDTEAKFSEIIKRRWTGGQCFHTPYMGTREFPVHYYYINDNEPHTPPISETRSLGLMLYDMEYITDNSKGNKVSPSWAPMYYMAEMKQGIIDLRNVEVLR